MGGAEIVFGVVGIVGAVASIWALAATKPWRRQKPEAEPQPEKEHPGNEAGVEVELLPDGGFGLSRDGFRMDLKRPKPSEPSTTSQRDA